MRHCELYSTMKQLAEEMDKPFPAEQPGICQHCPEDNCQIINGRLLFDEQVVSPTETDIAQGVENFTQYTVGKQRMERFHGILENHQVIYQNNQE